MTTYTRILVALLPALLIADPARSDETSHAKHPTRHSTQEQKAFGVAGDKRSVTRTVRIRMLDEMRFVPDRLDVRQGDTVRFVVDNTGKLVHELVIGTKKDLDAQGGNDGCGHDARRALHCPRAAWQARRGHLEVQPSGTL